MRVKRLRQGERGFLGHLRAAALGFVLGAVALTGCGADQPDFQNGVAEYREEAEPDAELEPVTRLTSDIEIHAETKGYITDLNVELSVEHPYARQLIVELKHMESGTAIALVHRPPRTGRDLGLTLDDSAATSVQASPPELAKDDEPAFPALSYRPVEPLEFFFADGVAGTWQLAVTNRSDSNSGLLKSWALDFKLAEEHPGESVYFSVPRDAPKIIAPGTVEGLPVHIRRLGGLKGELELSLHGGDGLSAKVAKVSGKSELGILRIEADDDVDFGEQDVKIRVGKGDLQRDLHMSIKVANYAADSVEMLSYLPLADLGAPGGEGSDCWGWTDDDSEKEYALVGSTAGLAVVDVSRPREPELVGFLGSAEPGAAGNRWRDVKVYRDRAYVVSEAGDHGLQVIDLRESRGRSSMLEYTGRRFNADFGQAHNIFINEDSGRAYVVGATGGGDSDERDGLCNGGLLVFDLDDPDEPERVACYGGGRSKPAYTHDVQCVIYAGPDEDYEGHEICISSDGQVDEDSKDWVAVLDMTDLDEPRELARVEYEGAGYAHQGWLTEDHRYFLFNDEFDEFDQQIDTRTYIWDLKDLRKPKQLENFDSPSRAVGHNTYIKGDYAYQANYKSGLRIVDISGLGDDDKLEEVAYFDTHPEDDASVAYHPGGNESDALGFAGAWSNYPYFPSGNVLVCDQTRGMFMLRPNL